MNSTVPDPLVAGALLPPPPPPSSLPPAIETTRPATTTPPAINTQVGMLPQNDFSSTLVWFTGTIGAASGDDLDWFIPADWP